MCVCVCVPTRDKLESLLNDWWVTEDGIFQMFIYEHSINYCNLILACPKDESILTLKSW